MDAHFPWQNLTVREWFLRLIRAEQSNDEWAALDAALSQLERYEEARDLASELRESRARLIAAAAEDGSGEHQRLLEKKRTELFMALSRQIIAQEDLRVSVAACRANYAPELLPFEAEMLIMWIDTQAQTAEEDAQLHNLVLDSAPSP